ALGDRADRILTVQPEQRVRANDPVRGYIPLPAADLRYGAGLRHELLMVEALGYRGEQTLERAGGHGRCHALRVGPRLVRRALEHENSLDTAVVPDGNEQMSGLALHRDDRAMRC